MVVPSFFFLSRSEPQLGRQSIEPVHNRHAMNGLPVPHTTPKNSLRSYAPPNSSSFTDTVIPPPRHARVSQAEPIRPVGRARSSADPEWPVPMTRQARPRESLSETPRACGKVTLVGLWTGPVDTHVWLACCTSRSCHREFRGTGSEEGLACAGCAARGGFCFL